VLRDQFGAGGEVVFSKRHFARLKNFEPFWLSWFIPSVSNRHHRSSALMCRMGSCQANDRYRKASAEWLAQSCLVPA